MHRRWREDGKRFGGYSSRIRRQVHIGVYFGGLRDNSTDKSIFHRQVHIGVYFGGLIDNFADKVHIGVYFGGLLPVAYFTRPSCNSSPTCPYLRALRSPSWTYSVLRANGTFITAVAFMDDFADIPIACTAVALMETILCCVLIACTARGLHGDGDRMERRRKRGWVAIPAGHTAFMDKLFVHVALMDSFASMLLDY
jgi:hypothetical protein